MPAHYQTLEWLKISTLFSAWYTPQNPLKILDFGCGPGKYLQLFSTLGYTVTGSDINPVYLEKGRQAGFNMVASLDELSPDTLFDIIFLSHLIEHLTPDSLIALIPKLCSHLAPQGRLIIISPVLGERFFHDYSHIRPYYPQSIRHAFGQTDAPLSFAAQNLIELKDIHFFRDPFKTRTWRSFYTGHGLKRYSTLTLNHLFDLLWRISSGEIGRTASWMGIYEKKHPQPSIQHTT